MHPSFLAAAVLTMSMLPATGHAQAPLPLNDGPRLAVFRTLDDSQWVRLAATGVGRLEGRIIDRSDTALVLSPERQPLRVPATSIDTLWSRGSSALTGTIAGVLLGGTIGVLAGLSCKEGDDCSRSQFMLLTGAVGAGAGGLIGLTIGALSPRWKRRFP